ncbi:S8 family serine peptidase [Piscinibacter sp.]|uniref:S8 family serine peptidase n=1 Tax=Piscinibacter sp. TaxID=1903157 RepID=UPI002C1502B1|nr:S8 family serine peptidase [Albitalea sp.]HUG22335.1 S8 family serine peptidase [Albitalea sp.]
MRKTLTAVSLGVVLALSLGGAQAQQSVPAGAAEGGRLWFVELSGAPAADGRARSAVQAEKAAFRQAAAAAGIRFTERRSFDTLFNGFSAELSPKQRLQVSRLPGVKALYPVDVIHVSPTKTDGGSAADLASAIGMTGADIAQNELGLSGAGVKVAVMDTGIDIDHPDFGGNGSNGSTPFPTARITHGYDLVGDAFNADPASPGYNPIAVPDPVPDDCNGHGTHVAGIVGASGAVTGVAPGVTFGAYRVFGCAGSTTADIMVEAMERALADGMHVLNMSIGSSFQWPQYPTAQAADRLVNKGMVVVASIGNSGTSGLYAAGAPGVGKKVIGVASYDNTNVALNTFTVSPDATAIGYAPATGAPLPPTSGSSPMSRTGTAASTADACDPLAPGSLTGTVALIRRGSCSFYQKSFNAQSAGAIGVVLYNNVAGRLNATVAGAPPITIPVVTISDTEGVLIDGRLADGPVTMTWTDLQGTFPNPTGGLISSFSSYGLAADLTLKPNIGAPGGLINSTYPLEQGGYATISGTSMASPHVAGGVALMLEAKPKTPSNAMRNRLQNSADPKNWWGNPALGFLDNVHRQGAGMLDIPGTVLATTTVEPGELALGESEAGPATRTLKIRNMSSSSVTYDLSHVEALATGPNTFTPAFFAAPADVVFSTNSLVVPARSTGSVDVTITAPAALADGSLYGGYVVATPTGEGAAAYRVPFAGYKGDYQSITVLTPTANGFPWLAKLSGDTFTNQPGGATYTLVGDDIPYFLVHLDHQSRELKLEAVSVTTGRNWNLISKDEYLPRNSTATGFFEFTWDGTTFRGRKTFTVPDGQYTVKLSVLKALGDADNPAHWETWTSPVVTIDRP